jgi:hypothetical protein
LSRLHSAYLTSRQLDIWGLMRDGVSQSEIARRLHISRQAVNQLAQTIPLRITEALNDAAKLNEVKPRIINSAQGILFGYSREFQTNVLIAVHPETGLRVWYQHNLGRCKICPNKKKCKSTLMKTIDVLNVSLTSKEKALDPSKLASLAFSKVLGLAYHLETANEANY